MQQAARSMRVVVGDEFFGKGGKLYLNGKLIAKFESLCKRGSKGWRKHVRAGKAQRRRPDWYGTLPTRPVRLTINEISHESMRLFFDMDKPA